MRSRVAPLTMQYWGEKTPGPVLLDSLAERRLFSRFDQVKWHRWRADGSLVILNGERLYRVWPSGEAKLLAAVGRPHPDPRLSPDGRWVALALGQSVAFVPTDGGPVKRLPQPGWVHSIGWHPDSKRLALSAGNRIRVASINGTAQTLRVEPVLTTAWWDAPITLADIPQVEWSPGGQYLAYRVIYRRKSAPGDCAEFDYDTRVVALRGRRQRAVTSGGYSPGDGLFSWALGSEAIAYAGNFGDADAGCWLWTPKATRVIFIDGTMADYRRSAWQPYGRWLAVEDWVRPFRDAFAMEGPVPVQFRVAHFEVREVGTGAKREDDWPEFEWAPSGKLSCVIRRHHWFDVSPIGLPPKRTDPVGDYLLVAGGGSVQAAAMGPMIREVQWIPGEREVSYVRQYERRNSGLFAAPLVRGRRGTAQARQWLASGKRLQHSRDIEEAAICFRNAVRCEPDWAEPRVRLARCYFALSKREANPACTAWLLWGAELEMQRAGKLTGLSDESRRLWATVSARREAVNSAVGIGLPRSWQGRITIRQPDYPIGGE